jgi:hypothetical protein
MYAERISPHACASCRATQGGDHTSFFVHCTKLSYYKLAAMVVIGAVERERSGGVDDLEPRQCELVFGHND